MSSVATPDLITAKEAKRLGLNRYFRGIACPKGHISEQSIHNHSCLECIHVRRKKQYAKWVADGKPGITKAMRRKSKLNKFTGKRFTIKTPLGMVSGIVVRSDDHHIWIRDHGLARLEAVAMIAKRWIVEGG